MERQGVHMNINVEKARARLGNLAKELLDIMDELGNGSTVPEIAPNADPADRAITRDEAARLLSLCHKSVTNLAKRGLIRAIGNGSRNHRYSWLSIQEYLAGQTSGTNKGSEMKEA